MAPNKVDEDQLMSRLADVFRVQGYEGASLSRIAEATGLQRASLYHRFPGGKEEMAEAVLARVDARFAEYILVSLTEEGAPAKRVKKMAQRLGEFFGSGSRSCLLDVLSLGDAKNRLQRHVTRSFSAWLESMTAVVREAGATPSVARRRAEDAMIQIQGALVFSRATGNMRPFERVLAGLPALLTEGLAR